MIARTRRLAPVLMVALAAAPTALADGPRIDFDRQIRPILADKCFACHGPDAETRESGLRLDVRDEALKAADSGEVAIVPSKPDESRLLKMINNKRGAVMPPKKTGKTLTDTEKSLLRDWIAQGAEYAAHWSFRAPVRVDPPKVQRSDWPRTPIDRFLLARMEKEGLEPSPETDKSTLIRRVTLDLTGLPPTPQELSDFLADERPDAYERLVDRLLASPRYGERMAVDWLDAARFADTHGYHIDSGRDMTRWRAWVIDAYNTNKPFDQFTVEQIAGDLLPNPTLDQKIASGFNRNHMINFEGGAVPEEYHTAYIVDRVNTTGTVWLGLTVGCAQCHDHKFDPIKQKEYYSLYAFFHNVPENGLDGSKGNAAPVIPAPTPEQQSRLDTIESKLAGLADRLKGPDEAADRAQSEWERSAGHVPSWSVPEIRSADAASKAILMIGSDGAIRVEGENPARETYTIRLASGREPITAIRLEVLPDDRYAGRGPGRSVNGNLVMTGVKVATERRNGASRPYPIAVAWADFSQETFPIANAIDASPESGWAILPEMGKPHEAVFRLKEPIPAGSRVAVAFEFQSIFANHQPGRFRVTATSDPEPLGSGGLPAKVREALAAAPDTRTDAQKAEIRAHYRRTVSPEFRAIASEIAALEKERDEIRKAIPTAMVMAEMPKPRDTFVLMRGQYDKKGEKVEAGVPSFLPPLPADAPKNRLGLARWLVSPENPLTARVAVNRLWQSFFGVGLAKTSEDFGTQGEPPSHPELLDWLALEFSRPESGPAWDVKRMVRMMVTSSAYRQSARVTPDRLAKDPENRLLSHAPRLRLPAEMLRDQALYVSGLLKEKIGGPSVSPYNPPGLWEELMSRSDGKNWTAQTYTQSHGDDLYRRTMYTFWKRTCPPPSLSTFDAPDREVCTVRRARTNTPLQALVMLNDPTYVEASRKMAERLLKEGGDKDEARISLAYRLTVSREPRAAELAILKDVLAKERAKFRAEPEKAAKLLGVGEAPRDEALDPAEVAAWSAVAGVVLNLDEAVTRG